MPELEKPSQRGLFSILAEWTGLEPATPGVTGRYSNQLNYHSAYREGVKEVKNDTTAVIPRPHRFTHSLSSPLHRRWLVGAERLELPTFAL
jgi:hypothetical protein